MLSLNELVTRWHLCAGSTDPIRRFLGRGSFMDSVHEEARPMKHYTTYEFDNRDSSQMYDYMEARIEALKRRIFQLEEENRTLRYQELQNCVSQSARVA